MALIETKLKPLSYLHEVKQHFDKYGDPEIAEGQRKYMRDQFEFYGLKAPQWLKYSKAVFKEQGVFFKEELITFTRLCFEEDHREMHYFALEMVQKVLKKQDEAFIEFIEELVLTKSWWDTVDWIAKFVGIHFQRFPELRIPVTEAWIDGEQMWLQRVALIFQHYKNYPTDEKMLFDYITRVKHIDEFFIQKAIGWSLRSHSKEKGAAVIAFIDENKITGLAKREGLKWLKQHGKI